LVSRRDATPSACVRQRLAEIGAPEPPAGVAIKVMIEV
jgi:hypothetical protein